MSEKPDGINDEYWDLLTREYPPATPEPCSECPWRRESLAGWLGPHSAGEWCDIAHGESPIACHKTIRETDSDGHGDWDHPAMRQCRGAAIFRANVAKRPKNPNIAVGPEDHESVFSGNGQFIAHHNGEDDYSDESGWYRKQRDEESEEEK